MNIHAVNIAKIESSEVIQNFEIRDKNNKLFFTVNVITVPESADYVHSAKIFNHNTNETLYIEDSSISYDIFECISEPADLSYNLSSFDVYEFIRIWGFSETSYVETKSDSYDCECCGSFTNIDFKLENSRTDTIVEFEEDEHFGMTYMPTVYDLFNFIMNGECVTDYERD